MRFAWFVLTLAVLTPLALSALQDDEQIHVVVPRDAIPAIDRPEFVPAEQARRMLDDNEIVIGLVGEHEQRAYSSWQLDHHEIVNDVFEGKPVAVTW